MQNKDNIIRQLYLTILGNKKTINELINYKSIISKNPCREIELKPIPYKVTREKAPLYTVKHTSANKPIKPIGKGFNSFPGVNISGVFGNEYNPIDYNRLRMFLFRFYIGKINWRELFYG
jgi:hypothetical protein